MTDFMLVVVGFAQIVQIVILWKLLNRIDKLNALGQLGNQLEQTTGNLKSAIENQKGK